MSPNKKSKVKGKPKRSFAKGKTVVQTGDIITLDDKTPHVEGKLQGRRVIKGNFGNSTLYDIVTKQGVKITLGGSFILDQKLDHVKNGRTVYITYMGKSGRTKLYEVSYD